VLPGSKKLADILVATKSTCYWSPDHVQAKPIVRLVSDKRRYVYVDELPDTKKTKFLAAAEKLNKKYHDVIENDALLQALKSHFNASLVVQQSAFDRAMKTNK